MSQVLYLEQFNSDSLEFTRVEDSNLLKIVEQDSSLSIGDWDGIKTVFHNSDEDAPLLWIESSGVSINVNPVSESGSIYKIYEIAETLQCWVTAEDGILYIPGQLPLYDPKNDGYVDLLLDELFDWSNEGQSIPEIIDRARLKPSSHGHKSSKYRQHDADSNDAKKFERNKKILNWVVIGGFLLAYIIYELLRKD